MKIKQSIPIFVALLFILSIMGDPEISVDTQPRAAVASGRLVFNSDTDLDTYFAGNSSTGEAGNPYILRDLEIDLGGTSTSGIDMVGTTKYVEIVNCSFINGASSGNVIDLDNVANVRIINCSFLGSSTSIDLSNSHQIHIEGNWFGFSSIISFQVRAIYAVSSSSDLTIVNNTLENANISTTSYAYLFYGSSLTNVSCNYNQIRNITSYNPELIYTQSSNNISIRSNWIDHIYTRYGSLIYIRDGNLGEIVDNEIGNVFCTYSGTSGICVYNHDNVDVENNYLHDFNFADGSLTGMYESNSENVTFSNNQLENFANDADNLQGIHINGNKISVIDNFVYNLFSAKMVKGIYVDGTNSYVANNIVKKMDSSGTFGVSGIGTYSYNGIRGNIVENNYIEEVTCSSDKYYASGIDWSGSNSNSTIQHNTIINASNGIYSSQSDNNYIINNTMKNGDDTGIKISSNVIGNIIFGNSIENFSTALASDGATVGSNQWNSSGIGNYYADYQSKYPAATASAGIWDTPYAIASGSNLDNYPLAISYTELQSLDTTAPSLDVPENRTQELGDTPTNIEFTFGDENPDRYSIQILFDGVEQDVIDGNLAEGSYLTTSDPSAIGLWEYLITVNDTAGNEASGRFSVEIEDTTAPVIAQMTDISIVEGSTGNSLTWTATDLAPSFYWIEDPQGQIVVTGAWTSGTGITYNFDGLALVARDDPYLIELWVNDTSGNMEFSSVWVTVTEANAGDTGTGDTGDQSDDGTGTGDSDGTEGTDGTQNDSTDPTELAQVPGYPLWSLALFGACTLLLIIKKKK